MFSTSYVNHFSSVFLCHVLQQLATLAVYGECFHFLHRLPQLEHLDIGDCLAWNKEVCRFKKKYFVVLYCCALITWQRNTTERNRTMCSKITSAASITLHQLFCYATRVHIACVLLSRHCLLDILLLLLLLLLLYVP